MSVEVVSRQGGRFRRDRTCAFRPCSGCRRNLLRGSFSKAARVADGLSVLCKACTADRVAARKYGLSFSQAVERFGKACGVCGATSDATRSLHVDHDHETGVVRGLLCSAHNRGLGFFHDNVEELDAAIEYLRSYQ